MSMVSKAGLSFKDVYVIVFFSSVLSLIGISQLLFFPNEENNFDPDVFIFIYGLFGVITWFVFKRTRPLLLKHILLCFFSVRILILAIQMIFFIVGPYYNEANEVAYYQLLARVLVDPNTPSLYRNVKYGMPPGFQFWLIGYQLLFFDGLFGFPRDMAFSLLNIAFEFGILFGMIRLQQATGFAKFTRGRKQEGEKLLGFGILFYSTSIFNVYYTNVRNFMDPIPIFLAIFGLYYFVQNKHGRAALLLSISTLMKFIPIFWLLLIILKFVKQKEFKIVFRYLLVSIMTAIIGFFASALFFSENPVHYFFEFFPQFYEWSILAGKGVQLNQAFWFPIYDSTFFLIGLISLIGISILFVWKETNGPTIHAFTSITSMYFVFQPWYDQRYLLWILPLICLDLLSSKDVFARIIWLFYISVYVYLFFMHFPLDLGIDTTLGATDPLVGNLYRLTGQLISYVGFLCIVVYHVRQVFFTPVNSQGVFNIL